MKPQKRFTHKKIIYLNVLFGCLTLLNLNGCASSGAPPQCPDSTGLQCARVDQINRQIDGGLLRMQVNSLTTKGDTRFSQNNSKMMPVWVAPYTDAQGNYREASYVDALIQSDIGNNLPNATKKT